MAAERFDAEGRERMLGILRAGDPRGDVQAAWWAKEAVRELYCCQPPRSWDHLTAVSATVMGPPFRQSWDHP
jgi:hypothetical protein